MAVSVTSKGPRGAHIPLPTTTNRLLIRGGRAQSTSFLSVLLEFSEEVPILHAETLMKRWQRTRFVGFFVNLSRLCPQRERIWSSCTCAVRDSTLLVQLQGQQRTLH